MKKIIALILTLSLLLTALAGCGGKTDGREDSDREETRAPKETDGGKEDKNPEETEPEETEPEKTEPEETDPLKRPAEKPSIEGGEIAETVLFDEMDVKITATKLECSRSGAEVTLLLENNTDKSLQFLSGTMGYSANSVNGWMVGDGYLNATVAPGKKSYETVYIDDANLALLGITDIADISLSVEIRDDDDYETYVITGPMRLETSLAAAYDYSADTYREAIEGVFPDAYEMKLLAVDESARYDHYGIRVLSQALVRNKSGNYIVLTELENTSEEDLDVYSEGFAVNGLIIEGSRWSSDTILAGKRAVMASNLSEMIDTNVWEVLGIGEIGRVDYALGLRDMEYNILMDAEALTFSVPNTAQNIDMSGTELFNGGGVRIIYKGFAEDDWDLSDDIHLVLLVENSTADRITVDDEWDSISINGFMTDCSIFSSYIPANSVGVMDMELSSFYLDDIQISSIEDIEELEVTLEISDSHYREIASPTIRIEK